MFIPSHKTTHSVKLQVPLGAVLEQAKFPVQFSNRPRTEDQTSTSGHRRATANERDRVAAIHERLLDAWRKQNPGKDPKKAAAWFRLLEQAKDEVAATQEGKRSRKAIVRPGVLAWGEND